MKYYIRKIHQWLGLTSGLLVFIIAVTGCLYAFQEEIQNLMAKIHAVYVGHVLNPFSVLNAPIVSQRFDQQVQRIVDVYNESMR